MCLGQNESLSGKEFKGRMRKVTLKILLIFLKKWQKALKLADFYRGIKISAQVKVHEKKLNEKSRFKSIQKPPRIVSNDFSHTPNAFITLKIESN